MERPTHLRRALLLKIQLHGALLRQLRQRREEAGERARVRRVGRRRVVRVGARRHPAEEAERVGVLLRVAELLTLLDSEETYAAVGVADGKHLAVGPPREAGDRVVKARVREEPLPAGGTVHHQLRVGGDECQQVHGWAPLHVGDVAAEALGGQQLERGHGLRRCSRSPGGRAICRR